MLKDGSQVAGEIVLEDEHLDEVGIAPSAKDVPGKRDDAEGREGVRMSKEGNRAPALGREGPKSDGSACEQNGRGAFG